jgi:hypothetical protein
MFGSAFELRVNYWVEVGLLTSPSLSPSRHVSPSLSWKYVYAYTNIRIFIIMMAFRAPSGYKVR